MFAVCEEAAEQSKREATEQPDNIVVEDSPSQEIKADRTEQNVQHLNNYGYVQCVRYTQEDQNPERG